MDTARLPMSADVSIPGERNRGRRGTWRLILAGHQVVVTEVFWSYWHLAAERQRVFFRRVLGLPGPWTNDSVISQYRFTNAYRAADRVSQYLLHHVIYDRDRDTLDTILRVLLFKLFNRIETWEWLVARIGEPDASSFDAGVYTRVLDERFNSGGRLYSAAYIMPAPNLGHVRKHENHLSLLGTLLKEGVLASLTESVSLEQLYSRLLNIQSFGPFLAYQYAIDLNYSPVFDFDEMDFVVPGPGALRGIDKCFEDTGGLGPDEIVGCMAASADEFLGSGSVRFLNLFGRPLHLVDCQNLFCEVDKYARVQHPTRSRQGPSRIKQGFRADRRPLPLGFPPKWGLPWTADDPKVAAELTARALRDVWEPLSVIRGTSPVDWTREPNP
ncbi:MAG: putative DNA base hypermodification protein [bacterium]|nr:putative DNA base hypermodification protein [bacterium]MDE0288623.1 putative DNA base hypermodification protein [bacterium]